MQIRKNSASSTATHRRCLPTTLQNCYEVPFLSPREVIMGWTHVETLKNYAPPPNKERVENHVSGDEPEILQKATYAQTLNGNKIGNTYG